MKRTISSAASNVPVNPSRHVGSLMLLAVLTVCNGCGDKKSTLEQQRLLLETMRAQQDTLLQLDKKKQELTELEKAHEKRLAEIEAKEAAIEEREKKLQAGVAEWKAYENKVQEEVKRLEQERALSEARAEFAKRRLPFLEQLASAVASSIRPYGLRVIENVPGDKALYLYNQFSKEMIASGILDISDDVEFEEEAVKLGRAFVKRYNNSAVLEGFEKVGKRPSRR